MPVVRVHVRTKYVQQHLHNNTPLLQDLSSLLWFQCIAKAYSTVVTHCCTHSVYRHLYRVAFINVTRYYTASART